MDALTVPEPLFTVAYNHQDITADLTPFLLSLTWTADLDGDEADSMELALEDSDGRWLNGWYPAKGDELTLQLGYRGALVPCGAFEIDEIELNGPPSQVQIKALAAGVTKTLRTHKGHAYEDTTLSGVVHAVAMRHQLRVVGEIEEIPVRRITQAHEQDLKFLKRLAQEYGYAFNVRGSVLTFVPLEGLRSGGAVVVLRPGDIGRYSFRDKIKDVPASASVKHHDSKTKALVSYELDAEGAVVPRASADSLKITSRSESNAQAKAKSRAALKHAQDQATVCNCTMWGSPRLVAGVNADLEDFGQLSGRYQVARSTHRIERQGGYTTELEMRRVKAGAAAANSGKGKKLKTATIKDGKVVLQ
ncbi:contractile injection system protein, VgrG/Pvc8 family [Acidovorax sp. SUPP3334]|uniref:phage late control D family protein n=1 Tax=Acidovorax sp. SUPP3334 TaxID=2920881 RepID=UPI0023DE44F9|nr:contractile injection system protein, VgrG/Pvc8 family [Acidovorax sp. SUPP3334]GKT21648.1 phage late control D family protein [Acidovorax sp. SUPP3334]